MIDPTADHAYERVDRDPSSNRWLRAKGLAFDSDIGWHDPERAIRQAPSPSPSIAHRKLQGDHPLTAQRYSGTPSPHPDALS